MTEPKGAEHESLGWRMRDYEAASALSPAPRLSPESIREDAKAAALKLVAAIRTFNHYFPGEFRTPSGVTLLGACDELAAHLSGPSPVSRLSPEEARAAAEDVALFVRTTRFGNPRDPAEKEAMIQAIEDRIRARLARAGTGAKWTKERAELIALLERARPFVTGYAVGSEKNLKWFVYPIPAPKEE